MRYIDGFVLVIKKGKVKEYQKISKMAGKIWKKYGALDYVEAVGDDMNPKWAKLTFPKMMKPKSGEKIFFSYIVYKNKAHRNKVNKQVMKDPFMTDPKNSMVMPFDMKNMAYGGFKALVDM